MAIALGKAVRQSIEEDAANIRRQEQHDLAQRMGESQLLSAELGREKLKSQLVSMGLSQEAARNALAEYDADQQKRGLQRTRDVEMLQDDAVERRFIRKATESVRKHESGIRAGEVGAYAAALNELHKEAGITYEVADKDGFRNGLRMKRIYPDGRVETFVDGNINNASDAMSALSKYVQTLPQRLQNDYAAQQARIAAERDIASKRMEHQMKMEELAFGKRPTDKEVYELAREMAFADMGIILTGNKDLDAEALAKLEDTPDGKAAKEQYYKSLTKNIAYVTNSYAQRTGDSAIGAMVRGAGELAAKEAEATGALSEAEAAKGATTPTPKPVSAAPAAKGINDYYDFNALATPPPAQATGGLFGYDPSTAVADPTVAPARSARNLPDVNLGLVDAAKKILESAGEAMPRGAAYRPRGVVLGERPAGSVRSSGVVLGSSVGLPIQDPNLQLPAEFDALLEQ